MARRRTARSATEISKETARILFLTYGKDAVGMAELRCQQLKAAGVTQPLFDDIARQGLYQATKGIPRKVNKLAAAALRLAAARQAPLVDEALLLDATAEAFL